MSASLEGEFWIIAVKRKMQAHLGQCTEFPWWSHYLLICWTPAENFQRHFPSKSKENSTRKVKTADFSSHLPTFFRDHPHCDSAAANIWNISTGGGKLMKHRKKNDRSLEAGSRAPLLQHFKARHFHLQPVFHRPSGSYPIRPGSPVVGDKRNINMPSSRSSLPGRITFKPHRSHLCYRAPPSLYLPHTLHTFEPIFWNCAYRRLKFII